MANVPADRAVQAFRPPERTRSYTDRIAALDRSVLVAVSLLLVGICGILDYATGGLRLAFAVTYAVPVAFGTWFVSRRFGLFLVVLSVATWFTGDRIAGVEWANNLVPLWNGAVRIGYYLSLVLLLSRLHVLQNSLEYRVRERTAALTRALSERLQLEQELLEIGDTERRRMGADLHDTLSQHLAGTALACAVLVKRLGAKNADDADQAQRVLKLIEEGTALSRNVARGLNPVELFDEGLMYALRDLATHTRSLFNVKCEFECPFPVLIDSPAVSLQLFRVVQEAVTNAVKHGFAKEIIIDLSTNEDNVIVKITDNGVGISSPPPNGSGMGLRIMGHRANLIGAQLHIGVGRENGTVVVCTMPHEVKFEDPAHG
jgi:signal transduction histidine kinase